MYDVVCECVCKPFYSILFEKHGFACGWCPVLGLCIGVGKMLVLLNKSLHQDCSLKNSKLYPQAPVKLSARLPCASADP